jgi:hypothetical protein
MPVALTRQNYYAFRPSQSDALQGTCGRDERSALWMLSTESSSMSLRLIVATLLLLLAAVGNAATSGPNQTAARPYYARMTWEAAAGAVVYDYGEPYNSVRRYGVRAEDSAATVTPRLQAIARVLPYLYFPPGTYRINATITRRGFSRWVGAVPQSSYNGSGSVTPEVVIFGRLADIGNGRALVQLAAAGIAAQSAVTENIAFASDLAVDVHNLASTDSVGVVGVDISHVKNGVEFVQTSFSNMQTAIAQSNGSPYTDRLTLDRVHINQVYRAISASPTAGISMTNTLLYDCFDFIDSTADVYAFGSTLNNSSYASENTQVSARTITWIGGSVEGGNNIFNPSAGVELVGVQAAETSSMSGAGKFLIRPQGDHVTVSVSNTRLPRNTRLVNLADVSSFATVTIHTRGLQGGGHFSAASDIGAALRKGLNYRGAGNQNNPSWNVETDLLSGSFYGTLNGCTSAPVSAVRYVIAGNRATLQFGRQTCFSNDTTLSFTLGELPAILRPAADVMGMIPLLDNSEPQVGVVQVTAAGAVVFGVGSKPDYRFTASGTKGFQQTVSFTYLLR